MGKRMMMMTRRGKGKMGGEKQAGFVGACMIDMQKAIFIIPMM